MFMALREATNRMTHHLNSRLNTSAIPKSIPLLPTELWLQILEHDDPKHLWLTVRNVSKMYKDRVERLFTSVYLHKLRIALSLPRRDPATSKLKWRGDPIPNSQLVMAYGQLNEDGTRVRMESPKMVKDRSSNRTLEELKDAGTLPKERLEEAPTNVNMSAHPMAALTIKLPVHVDWDEGQKIWVWEIEWRKVLSRFYEAKDKQSKRWPTPTSDVVPHGVARPVRGRVV